MQKLLQLVILSLLIFGCNSAKVAQNSQNHTSENLLIQQVADHVYQHTSFLETQSFGKVPCNGIIVFNKNEAIIFDTPADRHTSSALISWVENKLHCKVKAIIPTHFHQDCLGGLEIFHSHNIPSYANKSTIKLAAVHNAVLPQHGFDHTLKLKVGNKKVIASFVGEGHTRDNIIGYFPDEEIMFGGCLVKEINAGKGNLEDANVQAWPLTIATLKKKYPNAKIIIPGHGKAGGKELLDYTINLFEHQ